MMNAAALSLFNYYYFTGELQKVQYLKKTGKIELMKNFKKKIIFKKINFCLNKKLKLLLYY